MRGLCAGILVICVSVFLDNLHWFFTPKPWFRFEISLRGIPLGCIATILITFLSWRRNSSPKKISGAIATNQAPLISKSTDSPKSKQFMPHGLMVGSWVFILVALLTTVVTFLLPETYDAFARIKVEKKSRPDVNDPFWLQTWLQTQFAIIQSEPILTDVVQDLKLTERWSLRSGTEKGLTLENAVDLLRHSMLVQQSKNTSLIEIHAFSESPKEAAEIANSIAQTYAAYPQDDAGEIEIVDRATPPSRPVRPNKLLNIAIGTLGGIVLGALAGLVTTFVLRRKHSPEMAVPTVPAVSDRFWKRFAIAVALVLLALILIPVFAMLWIAVPAFQRAKREKPVPYLKTAISNAGSKAQKEITKTSESDILTRTADPVSALQFRLVLNNSETNVSSDLVTNFLDKSRSVPLHLARNILLDGTAVKAAGWQSMSNGVTNFIIEFTEDGSRQFEALTATNLNRQIAVIFQGHVLVAPVIQSRIHTSTLSFPVNWSQKDLERTMNALNWMHHRAVDLRFGPVRENVLPPLKNKWVFLNLRKNRLATNSYPDVESRAFHDWQRENGADLAATLSEKTPFLLGYGMAVVPATANGLNDNSPTDIWYNWDLMANEPQLKSHLIKNPKTGQDTYFFRTRDDTWGILQVAGFSENPPGVKIRYKLVQNGEEPSSKK
jgi:capsular polysaccharide biosynthesis protein